MYLQVWLISYDATSWPLVQRGMGLVGARDRGVQVIWGEGKGQSKKLGVKQD